MFRAGISQGDASCLPLFDLALDPAGRVLADRDAPWEFPRVLEAAEVDLRKADSQGLQVRIL
jgi:hypothetical protein